MNLLNKYVLPYLKAHFAGFGIALGLLLNDLQSDPIHTLVAVTGNQWIAIIGAGLGLGSVVGAVTNKPNASNQSGGSISVDIPAVSLDVPVVGAQDDVNV